MLKIHHLDNSRSQRILWLAEELGLEYEIVMHYRDPATMRAPASLKALHPLGKSPVIENDGRIIAESGAIIEYLVDRYGATRLAPSRGAPEYLDYLHWLHYAEGSAMPPVVMVMLAGLTRVESEFYLGFTQAELQLQMNYIDQHLAVGRDYLVGSRLSGADINLLFVLELAEPLGALKEYPRLRAYVERLQQRPAYQRALQRGGPYSLKMFGG